MVDLGERRAFPLIVRWLKHPETDDYEIKEILRFVGQLDSAETKPFATEYLNHKEPGIRLHAAMIFLKAGDVERALPVIGKAFSEANHSNVSGSEMGTWVSTVMKLEIPEACGAVAMLFDDMGIASLDTNHGFDRVACCRALEGKGNPAGLRFYRTMLDNHENGIPNLVSWGRPICHIFGEELLEGYAAHDESAKSILVITKPDSEERLTETKTWLDGRLEKLKTGGKKGP